MNEVSKNNVSLYSELSQIIKQGKKRVTAQVNSTLTLTYWQIGNRINNELLQNKRAEYGKQIVITAAQQLVEKYGNSFSARNLRRMMQFADEFSNLEIVPPVVSQLSWSHFIILFTVKNPEARIYYATNSIENLWSRRELQRQIERKAFERKEIASLQLSNYQPEVQNSFKDPYFLDFLGLKDGYLEKDLESAIINSY